MFEVIVDASLQEQKLNAFVSPPLTLPLGGELRAQRGKARRTVDELHQTCFSRLRASIRSLPLPVLYLLTFRSGHSRDAAHTPVKI